jgi:hypothetical protein
MLVIAPLACDDESTSPPSPTVTLSFQSQRIPSIVDSVAYAKVIAPDRIELVGFHSSCGSQFTGRLVQVDSDSGFVNDSILVDAEVSECVGVLCIVNVNYKYQATLAGVPTGQHRVILEQLIRHCTSGELLAHHTILDTVLTVP